MDSVFDLWKQRLLNCLKRNSVTLPRLGLDAGGSWSWVSSTLVIVSVVLGGKIKKFADRLRNPTRAAATAMVSA